MEPKDHVIYALARPIDALVRKGQPCLICGSSVNQGGRAYHKGECVMLFHEVQQVLHEMA